MHRSVSYTIWKNIWILNLWIESGHSCYGGHGKRSDLQFAPQEIEPVENQQGILRVLRRFPQPLSNNVVEISRNEINENEMMMKPMIQNMLRELIDETSRKIKEIEGNAA